MNSIYQLEVESEYWLEKALEMSENYIEQDICDWFFEADQDSKKTAENNEKVKKNTDTLIGNAARAVIKMIENIINDIKKWLNKQFSKRRLQTMQQQLRDSGKEKSLIKTADGNKINNVWKGIFKKTDDAINEAQKENDNINDNGDNGSDDNMGPIDHIINNIEGFANEQLKEIGENLGDVKTLGSAWTTTIAAEYGLRRAVDSAAYADKLLYDLEHDKRYMETLERDLGKAKAKQYKRKIKSLTKLISLYRLRVKLRGRYVQGTQAINQSIVDDCTQIINDTIDDVSNDKHRVRNLIFRDQAKGSFASSFSSKSKRDAARRADLRNKLTTNKHVFKGAKAGVNLGIKAYKGKEYIDKTVNTTDRTEKQSFFNKLIHGNND